MLQTIYDMILNIRRYLPFSKDEEWLLFINEDDLLKIWRMGQLDPPLKFWTLAEQREEAKKIVYIYGIKVNKDWEGKPQLVHIDVTVKANGEVKINERMQGYLQVL